MNKWIIAITVMLPTLIEIIDTSVVNVSLDHIRGSLSAGIDEATWAITMYLVANAIIIPMTGWLSRFFGRKLYLLISVTIFTLSSLMCGFAWSIESLIVFRVFQGLGGGGLQPISQAILLETFPPRQHGAAMAFYGVGIMFGPIVGPLLGGWITDNWSWHWIFFINIPIGILSLIMAVFFIKDPPYMERAKMRVDYWGLILVALGLGCLQMLLDQGQREDWLASPMIRWLTVISISSLALLVFVELRQKVPIVDLRLFKDISYSTGNIIMFCVFLSMFSSIVILPIYLQSLMGYTATLSGLVLGPGGLASIVGLIIAGRLVNKVNPKSIIFAGIILMAYSIHLMSLFNLQVSFFFVMWPRFILGLGMGLFFVPLVNVTVSHMPKEQLAQASSIFSLVRNLGGSFGVAFVTTILARRAQFHQARLIDHLTPFDNTYQWATSNLQQLLQMKGLPPSTAPFGAVSVIYQNLIREASMLAFNDVFTLLTMMIVPTILLVFILRKPPHFEGASLSVH